MTGGRRIGALYTGAVLTLLSGMFTTWAGAVRWRSCWRVPPYECPARSDLYGLWAEPGEPGAQGAAEPLAIGSLLLGLAIVALAVTLRPRFAAWATAAVGVCPILLAPIYWAAPAEPDWSVGRHVEVTFSIFYLGGLMLVGAVGLVTSPDDRPTRAAWSALTTLGFTTSAWAFFYIPQLWADSWDSPTWMWSFDGTLTLLVGAALLWALGRWGHTATDSAPEENDEHTSTEPTAIP